jgi:hypothetical protein
MMTMNDIFRSALLIASLALASACGKANPAQDAALNIENARRDAEATQRALAKLPPACTVGAGVHAKGKWLDAGPVTTHEAPAGCDYVWLQQDLGGQRQVAAVRYTFHRSEEPVTLANAAVFQSN